MVKNLKNLIIKNLEIFGLAALILLAALSTSYFNHKKNLEKDTYNDLTDNIYFKKTLKHIVENLDPKFKKIQHKIKSGETFDKILESYLVEKKK